MPLTVQAERNRKSFTPALLQRRGFIAWAVCAGFLLLVGPAAYGVDDHNPYAGDARAAKAGEYEFRINCALCHGLGAHGGGRGPDLTRAQKKHAQSDAELFQVISN